MSDERELNKYKIPDNENLKDYAMNPIYKNSLFIKNGVMYILGGVSSGKSTLLSKLMAVYNKTIKPIIIFFYAGLTPDETTTFATSNFNIKPYFVRLPTAEAMVSFFNQFRFKRLKLAELLMFLLTTLKTPKSIISCVELVQQLGLNEDSGDQKKIETTMSYIRTLKPNLTKHVYSSEYLMKTYSKKHGVNFSTDPILFITNCIVSFSKGFEPQTVTVDILNDPTIKPTRDSLNVRYQNYTFAPFVRLVNDKIEIVPSVSVFDDVAQFPLLTSERSTQWVKDLFAETRRWLNTFIIAAQRHNLLNKTLRSLTHTFFIGYSLVDDDVPKIAREIPSNLLNADEFKELYFKAIKPFTFFVYNNKLGYNLMKLS